MAEGNEGHCRVFIVDDERVIASTIATILQQHGYEACPFFTGKSALDAVRDHAPDVLISDLVMPGMSGVDLAMQVRKEAPACRTMLFSGHVNADVLLEEAERQGFAFPVHTKPIYPQRLLAMLSRWKEDDPAMA